MTFRDEFGLDVLALVGRLRHAEHRSIPEVHRARTRRGVAFAERTVSNLLDRYDELKVLSTAESKRLGPLLRQQGRVVLAIDGLQPDVGHEVLWVLHDCSSGEVLLARSLLSATTKDLVPLLSEVRDALPVPITGAISDGQESIRKAVAQALPGVPHQLCHFHYLREAVWPIHEADRHAKKELKKRVRRVQRIEFPWVCAGSRGFCPVTLSPRQDVVVGSTRGTCGSAGSPGLGHSYLACNNPTHKGRSPVTAPRPGSCSECR